MADHDHTVPARPCSFERGGMFTDPRASRSTVSHAQASLQLSDLATVALALYALERLRDDSRRYGMARDQGLLAPSMEWPLSPLFAEGLVTAIRCLKQYAHQLGYARDTYVQATV